MALSGSATEVVERLMQNWPAVSELYVSNARIALATAEPFALWEKYAFACLSRAHYTVESTFRIRDREADVIALTRTVYAHVVAFAWLLIAPEDHYLRLVAWENKERTKMVKGFNRVAVGHTHAQETVTIALTSIGLDPTVASAPETFDRAGQAQEYWSAKVPNWEFGFARNYENMFRAYSTHVHPTIAGLMRYFDPTPGADPSAPRPLHPGQVPAEGTLLFASMLVVSAEVFGWPSHKEIVDTTFNGFKEQSDA